MMNLKKMTVLLFTFALLGSGLAGCAEDEATENKMDLFVYPDALSQPNGFSWRSVSVEIEGVGQMPCQAYTAGTGQTISLPKIPYGTTFKVILGMYATEDCQNLLARGSSVETSIDKGDAKQQVFVHVAPAGSFTSPIIANSTQQSLPFYPRVGASYTTLNDGKVVIIGGARLKEGVEDDYESSDTRSWLNKDNYAEILDTVEIYDPATGIFELVMPPGKGFVEEGDAQTLYYRRAFHSAVYLPGKNQIAVVGGLTQAIVGTPITASPSIELFDLTNRQFIDAQAVGPMNFARIMPGATMLEYSGEELLLVTGGTNFDADPTQAQLSYEVIAPIPTGHIKDFNQMIGPRYGHEALFVQNQQGARYVYLIGGQYDAVNSEGVFLPFSTQSLIDIFDVDNGYIVGPPQGRSAPAGLETSGRVGHTVHYLPPTELFPASIYVIGGYQDVQRKTPIARIEVLSAENGAPMTSAADGFVLAVPRGDHSSAILPDGRIMVSGGLTKDNAGVAMTMTGATEIIGALYPSVGGIPIEGLAPIQSTLVSQASMTEARFGFKLFSLENEQVMAIGGLRKVANVISEVVIELAATATGAVVDPNAVATATTAAHAEVYVHHPSDLCQDSQGFCKDTADAGVAATGATNLTGTVAGTSTDVGSATAPAGTGTDGTGEAGTGAFQPTP